MAQLNLYVPEDLASRLKREARRAGVPLSRYVVSLLSARKKSAWPPGYFEKTCGFLREDFPEPDDRAPEPVEASEIRQ
jgi:hypothetical protein